jgi:hypothetical protein
MHPSSTQPADQIGNAHSAQPANNSNTARQKRKPRNPPWFDPHNPGLGGEAAGPPPDGRVGLIGIDENESTQVGDEPLSFDEEDGDTNEDRTREFGLGQNDQTNEREQPHGHCDDDRSVDPEAARLVALQSLYASLYVKEKPINGTWIPTWLVRATGTEARAAVLAELLWWFEPAFSDARRQERASSSNRTAKLRARARVYDAGGLQWLAISIRRLAARTMLSASTTAGALRWLKSEGLLAVEPGKIGSLGSGRMAAR